MRNKVITDGQHVYKVCYPTINGVIATNEEGDKVFICHPNFIKMQSV